MTSPALFPPPPCPQDRATLAGPVGAPALGACATVATQGLLLDIVVPGAPVPKGRPRVAVRAGHAHAYTPERTARWEDAAAWAMRQAWTGAPLDVPVEVDVTAVFARPLSLVPRPRQRNPPPAGRLWSSKRRSDADNVAKIAMDSLVKAGVLRDDCLVVLLHVRTVIAALDEGPGVAVLVYAVPERP